MKITNIETFFYHPGVGKNLLFIKVDTDEGIYGWGEAYVTNTKEKVVSEYLNAISPLVIGREAYHIRHLGQTLLDDFAIRRNSVDLLCAWSAIELALWDIVGKKAGLPLHRILGGAVREKIRLYANGWWFGAKSIDDTVKRALNVVAQGYDAIKWDPFPGPWRTFISRADETAAVENVKAVREAVGPKVELLIDGHRRLAPNHAIRVIERLEEYDIGWYEEPCPPENIDLTVEVKRSTHTPIVLGEALYTKEGFVPVFEKRAADIINPDICAVGGLLSMLEIAALAAPHGVAVTPHNYNSPIVGLAATVHLSAVIPNFNIAEVFVNLIEPTQSIATQGITIANGWADVPDAPGLGIDLDINELKKRPYSPLPGKGLRDYREEFPRKVAAVAPNVFNPA